MNSLDIVIVNWNAGQQLCDCLKSIEHARKDGFEIRSVVVVDNASSDHSVDRLGNLNLPLRIVRNRQNRGFAAACNQGVAGSTADLFLFLNPDTRLRDNSIREPIRFMAAQQNADVGTCGIQLIDGDGQANRTCARFPEAKDFFYGTFGLDRLFPRVFPSYVMREWAHDHNREVNHVMGAFFLVRSALFRKLGGFDERFFVYLEDLDFSLRAHRAGWRTYFLATAKAYHKGGGTSEQVKAKRLSYALQSRILYGFKHFGEAKGKALMLATLLIEPLTRIGFAAIMQSPKQCAETIEGFKLLTRELPTIWRRASGKQDGSCNGVIKA